MKHLAPRLVAGAAIALLARAAPLTAQEDFMSADLERPLLVEDAFPLKFLEWVGSLPGRWQGMTPADRCRGTAFAHGAENRPVIGYRSRRFANPTSPSPRMPSSAALGTGMTLDPPM